MRFGDLDDAIKAHIAAKPGKHPIYSDALLKMAARELGRGDLPFGDDKEWRLIDRRLQALKKGGHIKYVRPNWELV